jgi:hypothetical protein
MTPETLMPDGNAVNYDGLLNNRFNIVFDKLPNTVFFLQGFNLPEIRVEEVSIPTPIVDYNDVGEKINFDPYTIHFLVDSNMRNWIEIYAWMKRMTSRGSRIGEESDATVYINGKDLLKFRGCWPMSLGSIDMDSTTEEAQFIKCSLTVNYDYLDVNDPSVENY